MYCQKCRTPLKLDSSLEDLNPAAFDLLIGSTGKSLPDRSKAAPRASFPPERQELYDRVSRRATSPVYKRTIPPSRHGQATSATSPRSGRRDSPAMSFVMLSESQLAPPHSGPDVNVNTRLSNGRIQESLDGSRTSGEEKTLSYQMERTTRLFEIISARSDIDHPICTECTDMLLDGLQKRLQNATKERDAYISFLKNLNGSVPSAEDVKATEEDLKGTLAAEDDAFQELLLLEKEKAAVDKEIAELEEESRKLDLEEEQFWRDRNAFTLKLSEFQNERDALNMKYDHDSRQLDRLQRTNVYNDTFCIGHDGFYGTINGLRMGRGTDPSVEWSEINAAWGQTVLLLATLADRLGFQFQGYRLKPMGSTSKIEKIELPPQSRSQFNSQGTQQHFQTDDTQNGPHNPKITSFDLFSTGDLPLGFPWGHRRFDAGMVAFLECLRQLAEHVEKTSIRSPASQHQRNQDREAALRLPYPIKRDKIGDASIKLGFTSDDKMWTKACKYTLTCCKFLLAHVSNVAGGSSSNVSGASAAARTGAVSGDV